MSAVESNIVGYQNTTMQSGLGKFSLVSVPFAHVNADGKGIMLNKDITVQGAADPAGGDSDKCDQIWIWTGYSYLPYYWYEGSNEPGDETGWWGVNSQQLFEVDYTDGIPSGNAFMIKANNVETDREVIYYSPIAK